MKKKEKQGKPKIPRQKKDLIKQLVKNVTLLKKYSILAFKHDNKDYLGEVAGKIRLLTYSSKGSQNKPLLLDLMDKYKFNKLLIIDGPPLKYPEGVEVPVAVTLRDYLEFDSVSVMIPDKGMQTLTKKQFINLWASQDGSAHVDWELHEVFARAISTQFPLFGINPHEYELKSISNQVIYIADEFLNFLKEIDELN